MMAPRGKKMMGVRRGPPPEKGPMPQGIAPQRGVGVPKMGIGMPAEMAPPSRMRMAAETMGTSAPTPMKKGGLAKKGEGIAKKGFEKGGMAKAFSGVPAEMAKKMSGMKKSGKAKTYEGVPAAAAKFAGMKKGGVAKKAKGGMMLVIGIGKKKGK